MTVHSTFCNKLHDYTGKIIFSVRTIHDLNCNLHVILKIVFKDALNTCIEHP